MSKEEYVVRIQIGLKHRYYIRTFRRALIYTDWSIFAKKLTYEEAKEIAKLAEKDDKRVKAFIESIN